MSTILPKDEKIRRAVQWISDHLENSPAEKLMGLLNQAASRFDLSPTESDFLLKFYKDSRKNEPKD